MAENARTGDPSGGAGALRTAAILFVACACGWIVMELEILGGRILAPYFGSSVHVWGSVIGVFLLSLAVGYLLGGWLSRRPASKRNLGACIVGAGAWLCVLPTVIDPVCEAIYNALPDVRWGSLAAAAALFAAPTVLLGTVSPTVIRWLTERVRDSGFNAGLVFALSTVASFAGCLVTAFFLVLFLMSRTIMASGAVLLIVGGAVLLHAALRPGSTRSAPASMR